MKKYLLSDGRLTTSHVESIIDELSIRLKLWKNEIPHSNLTGLDKNYDGILESDMRTLLYANITDLVKSISDKIIVDEIIIGRYNINIIFKIDSVEYELSVRN